MICLNFTKIIGESNNIIVCSLAKACKTIPRKNNPLIGVGPCKYLACGLFGVANSLQQHSY